MIPASLAADGYVAHEPLGPTGGGWMAALKEPTLSILVDLHVDGDRLAVLVHVHSQHEIFINKNQYKSIKINYNQINPIQIN